MSSAPHCPQTGDYYFIEDVALQGQRCKHTRVGSVEEALKLARDLDAAAFHFYLEGDVAFGDLYIFTSVTGVEARPRPGRRAISCFLERQSVHGKDKTMRRSHTQPTYDEYVRAKERAEARDVVANNACATAGSASQD